MELPPLSITQMYIFIFIVVFFLTMSLTDIVNYNWLEVGV